MPLRDVQQVWVDLPGVTGYEYPVGRATFGGRSGGD